MSAAPFIIRYRLDRSNALNEQVVERILKASFVCGGGDTRMHASHVDWAIVSS